MHDAPHELIIDAETPDRHYWADLWRYRQLFYFLAWRDILVRYKQTAVGIGWALIRPLATMVIFTIVFGKFARLPSDAIPYPMLVFAALLPWQFFSNAVSECSTSLVSNSNLISKTYFPRLVVPASSIVTSFVDFLISAVFLAALMVWYQFLPSWRIFTLPLFAAIAFAASLGIGLWFTALTVKYRDFRFIVPFLIQFGFFLSPVGYSTSVVPEQWRLPYSLNPMVGVIEGFRWAIHGGTARIYLPGLALSVALVAVLLLTGLWYFRKTERSFADVI